MLENRLLRTGSKLCAIAGVLAWSHLAHSAHVTDMTVTMGNNLGFSITINNTSTSLTSFVVRLEGTAADEGFDTISGGPWTVSPDIGSNNNGTRANTLTITFDMPLTGAQTMTGDIDDEPTGIEAVFFYNDGHSEQTNFPCMGTEPNILCQGGVNEPEPPPPPPPEIPPFECAQTNCGVTLTWEAPTENVDNTPLTDLAGFGLYWGMQSRVNRCSGSGPASIDDTTCYDFFLDIPVATQTSEPIILTVTNPTSYFFAAVAYNLDGVLSDWSNELEQTFQPETIDPPPTQPQPPLVIEVTCETEDTGVLTCMVTDQSP